jgi:MFS transporter, FHS family, glucose/mannose:H+ symporter
MRVQQRAAVYLGFAGTGVALTQPGALMPVLLARWGFGDGRGGVLLFCFFVATSLGALSSRGRMNRSGARGAALTAVGALWLAVAGRNTSFGAVAAYGLGLGIAMTSVSLLQSRLLPDERRVEMTRLNLVWAIGASVGPWLALRAWHGGGGLQGSFGHAQVVFCGLAVFFAVFAAWMRWFGPVVGTGAVVDQPAATRPSRWALLDVPWPLLVLVFCATGVEASAGGWLTTFAQRNADTLGTTIGAATCLWAGLLAGRIVHSTRWAARLSEGFVLGSSTLAMAAALGLLVAWPVGIATMVAAASLGFAVGPVYPLLLALVLRRREHGAVFVIAGVGSSTLPLATGAVSAWTHSLRAGLSVPLLAAIGMVAMVALWRTRETPTD